MFSAGLFPTSPTDLYIGSLNDGAPKFIKIGSSIPNVVEKLYPQFITGTTKILYTAFLNVPSGDNVFSGSGYQLRVFDNQTNEDFAVGFTINIWSIYLNF